MEMTAAAINTRDVRSVKARQVALPVEHGGWSFLFEPIVAGLAISFSIGGVWIAVMIIGAFLLRRPLSVWAMQVVAGRQSEFRSLSAKYAAAYALVLAAGAVGILLTVDFWALLPLIILPPLAVFQLYSDVYRQNRQMLPETAGALAMSASAAAIILAGGSGLKLAAAVWFFLAARLITSIVYVRDRLSAEKGKPFTYWPAVSAHVVALVLTAALAAFGKLPFLTIPAMALLLFRASVGLSHYRKPTKAMKIGIIEVMLGIISLAALIAGHYLGI
jgi:hypothetical protein